MKYLRIAVLVAVGIMSVSIGTAAASCDAPTDLATALDDATVVFVGEVVAVRDQSRIADFRVLSIWKGPDLPERLEIRGTAQEGARPSPDDARFAVGRTYLVVPENGRSPFLASGCSATRPFTAESTTTVPVVYRDAVGSSHGRAPIAPQAPATAVSGKGSVNLVLAGGIAISGFALSVFGLLRGRRHDGRGPATLVPGRDGRSRALRRRHRRPVRRVRHTVILNNQARTIARTRRRTARK